MRLITGALYMAQDIVSSTSGPGVDQHKFGLGINQVDAAIIAA